MSVCRYKLDGKKELNYTYTPDEADHYICPRCNDYVAIDNYIGERSDYNYLVCRRCFFIFKITHENNSKVDIKHAYSYNHLIGSPHPYIYHFGIPTEYSIKGNTFKTIEIEKKSESMVYIKSIGKVNINDVKIVAYKCSCIYGKNCTLLE
jgi:hypothetical protein